VARSNDLPFVRDVTGRLEAAGIVTWVFGGWAEELLGLRPARAHRDVDLLYPAADFTQVDTFLASGRRVTEIAGKRFPHKRAFLDDGIMVELLLVQSPCPGEYVTIFWGDTPHQWPHDVFSTTASGLRLASAASLRSYRASHPRLRGPRRPAGGPGQPGR
jgi:hypothetical protein